VVEAALAKFTGAPVAIELLDGGGSGDDGGSGGPQTADDGSGRAAASPPSASQTSSGPLGNDSGRDADAVVERASPRERGMATAAAIGESGGAIDDQPNVLIADLPDDDDVDLDDLIDAPPESVKSPIDRLAEAFPGSELIEEAG